MFQEIFEKKKFIPKYFEKRLKKEDIRKLSITFRMTQKWDTFLSKKICLHFVQKIFNKK